MKQRICVFVGSALFFCNAYAETRSYTTVSTFRGTLIVEGADRLRVETESGVIDFDSGSNVEFLQERKTRSAKRAVLDFFGPAPKIFRTTLRDASGNTAVLQGSGEFSKNPVVLEGRSGAPRLHLRWNLYSGAESARTTEAGMESCTRQSYCFGCGMGLDGSMGCGFKTQSGCPGKREVLQTVSYREQFRELLLEIPGAPRAAIRAPLPAIERIVHASEPRSGCQGN